MAGKKKRKVRAKDLEGFKYLELLEPFLERLHKVGTERDVAGNRDLHFDQYTSLVLLYFFSPIVTSLRGLQQARSPLPRSARRRLATFRYAQSRQAAASLAAVFHDFPSWSTSVPSTVIKGEAVVSSMLAQRVFPNRQFKLRVGDRRLR